MAQKESFEALTSQESNPIATYHIYHTGTKKQNFSIHTTSDSRTLIKLDDNLSSTLSGKNQRPLNDETLFERRNTWGSIPHKVKRAKYLEKAASDPRIETSPYYLQRPTLYGKDPPFVLRHGATKRSPPAVLMNPSFFWKKWTLQFGDILERDGVIDGRGVVGMKYGTKKGEDGTLKGYSVREKRYLGESGKEWHAMQKTLPEDNTKPAFKAKPDEVVELCWASPLSTRTREYHFRWRNFTFKWKGTKAVRRAENIFQYFMRYSHLKLVVVIPGADGTGTEEEKLLAQYTCVPASRKVGRLELHQDALDSFLAQHVHGTFQMKTDMIDEKKASSEVQAVEQKTDERLRDVLVASAMCMIISEWQKRQVIIQLVLLAADAAG